MFAQNADGLMDCSVWAIQSECEETVISDGGVCMTHRQVWKPVPFGPKTQRQHQMWELFLRGVSDVLRSPWFTQQVSTIFRKGSPT